MRHKVFVSFLAAFSLSAQISAVSLKLMEPDDQKLDKQTALTQLQAESQFFGEMIGAVNDWNCGRFCRMTDAIAHNFLNPCCPPGHN